MSENTLENLWKETWTDKYDHWYLPFYDEVFQEIQPLSLLEIGVLGGDSLRMWRQYLPECTILGVDIREPLNIAWCVILKADATSEWFADMLGMWDVIIDDWGHRGSQQRKSFENLRPHVNEGGIYIVEDICCSFREKYIDEKPTMYEYLLNFCAKNNVKYKEFWKTGQPGYDPGTFILYK